MQILQDQHAFECWALHPELPFSWNVNRMEDSVLCFC